jgi:diguanylate cyclase (GGDEF)-like protein
MPFSGKGWKMLKILTERLTNFLYRNMFVFDIIGYFLVGLIGFINGQIGKEISIAIFYVYPIFLVTWLRGKTRGMFIAIVAAVTWSAVDLMQTHTLIPSPILIWNAAMRIAFFLLISHILASLKMRLENEQRLARTDFLTGAVNARHFFELAAAEIYRTQRYQRPFTALYLDLDNFKAINDSFGHTAGDKLLKNVVVALRENLRQTDVIARLGGDEFVIMLPETGEEPSSVVADKVQQKIRETAEQNGWPVTSSVGMVTFLRAPESVDEMLKQLDAMMYAAKNSGKNSVKRNVLR